MRITFITTSPNFWGGCEELWTRCANQAIKGNHSVQVIVYEQKKGLHPCLIDLKGKVESFIELENFMDSKSLPLKAFKKIYRQVFPENLSFINSFKPDVILISQPTTYGAPFHPLLYPFLKTTKFPFYLISQFNTEYGALSYPDILKSREIFKKARNVFFVSNRNKKVAERQIACNIDNGIIIDNPLNLKDYSYISYPSNSGKYCYASVARLEASFKGQDILFECLSGDKWRQRNWILNLYGQGPDENYLNDLVKFYGLENKVFFKGHVSDIREVWKNNHLLLMPSIAEGKPLALEEAMICGRTAVVSDVAGNGELITDQESGFLASSFLPAPFENALEESWKVKDSWEEMGRVAHDSVMSRLDLTPELTVLNDILKL